MESTKHETRALFVVHAKADTWFVRGALLPALGLPPEQVQLTGELPLGGSILEALERGIATSRTTVVVLSAAFVADGWSQHTALLASHATVENGRGVVPLYLDDAAAPLQLRAMVSLDLRDRARWDAELGRLAAFLGQAASRPAIRDELPCPYPGLRSLEREDEGRLYGRARELDELALRLGIGEREVFLIGPSGSGKSSLINAGVVPRLERGVPGIPGVVVRRFRPGSCPLTRLLEALEEDGPDGSEGSEGPAAHPGCEVLAEQCPASPGGSIEALHASIDRLLRARPAGHLLLLHVDQLEEAFALASEEEQARFFTALAALRAAERCLIVSCLRADFFAELIGSPLWIEGRTYHLVISPLRGEGLREAIVRPALSAGVYLEPALAERLLADASGAAGVLPLVQETLVQLWALRRHRVLSLASYEQMGGEGRSGLAVAMSRRADACLRELSPAREQIARRILLRLVSFGDGSVDTRWPRPRTALELEGEPPAECEAVLEHLIRARLITTDADRADRPAGARRSKRESSIELAHEALIKAWNRLAGWIGARRADGQRSRQLEQAAASWVARGRGPGGLLEDDELAAVQAWQRTEGARELGQSADLTDLLQTSAAAQRHRRRRRDRAVWLLGALISLVLALVSTAILLGTQVKQGLDEADVQRTLSSQLLDTTLQQRAERDQETARQHLINGRSQRALPYLAAARLRQERVEPGAALRLMFHQAGKVWLSARLWHDAEIHAVTFSPDGELVATASADGTARLWQASTGEPASLALVHDGDVLSVAFSPDGTQVVTGGADGLARIWSVLGAPVASLRHAGAVRSARFSPDGTRVATASDDGTARVWDARSGEAVTPPLAHDASVLCAELSRDGALLATGSADYRARVWRIAGGAATGGLVATLVHRDSVATIALSPDGTRVLTSTREDNVQLWALGTRKAIRLRHPRGARAATFSPDGARVVTAGEDRFARLWDARSGKPLGRPLPHDAAVNLAIFSRDGSRILTVSDDKMAQLWDAATGLALSSGLEHDGAVRVAAFAGDGHRIVTAGADGVARIWQLEVSSLEQRTFAHEKLILAAAFSPGGEQLVTAGADRTARLWSVASGEQLRSFLHGGRVEQVALGPDGKLLATASADGAARLWNVATGRLHVPPLLHAGGVLGVAFSRDGNRLVTASRDRTAQVWDVATGLKLFLPLRHPGAVTAAELSPDGARVATACRDGLVRVWELATGQPSPVAFAHRDVVESVQFSPDGSQLVTASRDRLARVWNVATGQLAFPELEHENEVEQARYSPDGVLLATASRDKRVCVWDAHTGALVASRRHADELRTVAWSPDGAWLVVGGNQRLAQLWDVARDARPLQAWSELAARGAFQLEGDKLASAPRAQPTLRSWASGGLGELVASAGDDRKDMGRPPRLPHEGQWSKRGPRPPRRKPPAPLPPGEPSAATASPPPVAPARSPPGEPPSLQCSSASALQPAGEDSGCAIPPTADSAHR